MDRLVGIDDVLDLGSAINSLLQGWKDSITPVQDMLNRYNAFIFRRTLMDWLGR